MPGLIGTEGIETFLQKFPEARVIMISTEFQRKRINNALKFGARNYFLKPITESMLKEILREFKKAAV